MTYGSTARNNIIAMTNDKRNDQNDRTQTPLVVNQSGHEKNHSQEIQNKETVKDPNNRKHVDQAIIETSVETIEKPTGIAIPVNAQNNSQSQNDPHTITNDKNQKSQFLGTPNSNSKIPTCTNRAENSLLVPESVLVDCITTPSNPSTSTNPKRTNHPPVSEFPPISSNFQKFNSKNSKNPVVSLTPTALPPKTKPPTNQPTTTNHPPPPIAKQSMATRLRAKQAEPTTRIDLTPPKRVTKQGCPAIMFKREDYMIKMAESCKYTLVGKFYSPMPKMEVPLAETTTSTQEGSRKAKEQSTNQNRNEVSNDQWETQKRRKFKADGGEDGIQEKPTNLQDGVSRGGVLSHVLRENFLIDPRNDFRAPATTTNMFQHPSSQQSDKMDLINAQRMASKLTHTVSADVGANQPPKQLQQVVQMHDFRPAGTAIEFGQIAASGLGGYSAHMQSQKLQVLGQASTADLEENLQHQRQSFGHIERAENDQATGCSFSTILSDQVSSPCSHQVQDSNSKQQDTYNINDMKFSATPSNSNQPATSKTLRRKRARKKKLEKQQEVAASTPTTTIHTSEKDNNDEVVSSSCSQYVLLDQTTPIRSPDFGCEDPLNLTPLNIQPAPFMQPENATNILRTNNEDQTSTPASDDEYSVIHSEDEYDQDFQGEVEFEDEGETTEQSIKIAAPSKTTTKVMNDEMNQLASEQGLSPRGIYHNSKFTTIRASISRPNTRLHNLRSHQ
ncbi:uncharacterized protein LOC129883626 [Solanum dulcamara]|uniref:uncharacterized protein LOC129883626 n=1 Tax=Solanum dulcamara TaxID=45834 RepID=UPI0024867991|nr:uncharacterized protein LOC129883626 [Solanum dulcamara]